MLYLATSPVGEWIIPTIFPRREANCSSRKGSWKRFAWTVVHEMNELAQFWMCFPEQWVKDAVIPATNKEITGEPLTLSEFYVYLGCYFFMACFEGISDQRLWWLSKPISMRDRAPFHLNEFISLRRFEDRLHDVRQMIDAFDQHYTEEYIPSWLSCLDESMNSWLDKFCPGFMSVPQKPHPLGNEYHSIADGNNGKPVMWRIKLQEGKDHPKDATGK
ncbi:hypothetical protein ACHAW6_000238 [Cyclotella cf. meneghiniana]